MPCLLFPYFRPLSRSHQSKNLSFKQLLQQILCLLPVVQGRHFRHIQHQWVVAVIKFLASTWDGGAALAPSHKRALLPTLFPPTDKSLLPAPRTPLSSTRSDGSGNPFSTLFRRSSLGIC